MKPKIAKMRLKMAKMRLKMAKMGNYMQALSVKISATLARTATLTGCVWHAVADHAHALKGRAADSTPPGGTPPPARFFFMALWGLGSWALGDLCDVGHMDMCSHVYIYMRRYICTDICRVVWLDAREAELVAYETGVSCGRGEASKFGAEHRRTVRAPTTEFIIVYNGA